MREALSSVNIGVVAALLILGVFAALFAWVVLAQRRKTQVRESYLLSMGFSLVDPPPPNLVARIAELRRGRPNPAFTLTSVFHRPIGGGDLYIFDLEEEGDSEGASADAGMVAVVSDALDLPRISLLPKPPARGAVGGMVANLTDRLISWAAERAGLTALDFSDDPDFQRAYVVMGDDVAAVRRFLSEQRRIQLVGMARRYAIAGKADVLILSRSLEQQSRPATTQDLYAMREDAERLLAWFRGGSMTYLQHHL